MRKFTLAAVLLGLAAPSWSALVSFDGQKLVYEKYANQGESNKDNRMPDFSFAGYKKGGVKLPVAPVKVTLAPVSGDDRDQIQDAIDLVSSMPADSRGIRGAVLLKAGQYEINGSLRIRASGVTLRGEGQGPNGTVILNRVTERNDTIVIEGANDIDEIDSSRTRIGNSFVGAGAHSFDVQNGSAYRVGDLVRVIRTPNDAWINMLNMDDYGWSASGYRIAFERRITAVSGNRLSIDLPIVDPMKSSLGGGEVVKITINGRLKEVGVENLRLDSVYSGSTDENHAWYGIHMSDVENSWVKNVTVRHHANSAVYLDRGAYFNTIQDSASIDPVSQITGGRRYPWNIAAGAGGNLFQRVYARHGRHSFVTGPRVPGPNVFLDSVAENTYSDSGPHHRWATGILFDNLRGGDFAARNRTDSGSGHGWVGAQIVFWNNITSELICQSPKGGKNFAIGNTGPIEENNNAPNEADCHFESHGKAVIPRSLYISQLRDRLGDDALDNVLWPIQKTGTVYTQVAMLGKDQVYVPPTTTTPPTGTPPLDTNATYKIIAKHSGKVLDVQGKGVDNGVRIQQYSWNGGDHQKWKIIPVSDGYYRITVMHTGKVADVYQYSLDNGAAVNQWTWKNTANQLWSVTRDSAGNYRFKSKQSGKYLAIDNCSTSNGARLEQTDSGSCNQWILEKL